MAAQNAIVKAVLSGDTFVCVIGSSDRTVSLSNIRAPRLGRYPVENRKEKLAELETENEEIEENLENDANETSEVNESKANGKKKEKYFLDEPFAWESREFLRSKLLSQQISIISKHSNGNHLFCEAVWKDVNLSELVVSEGWARVRPQVRETDPAVRILKILEEEAQKKRLGLFNASKKRKGVRTVAKTPISTSPNEKPKEYEGIVELVRSGSALRVAIIEPEFHIVDIILAGIVCPQMIAKKADGNEEKRKEPEPFYQEAKEFTERYTYTRKVNLRIVSQHKNGDFRAIVTLFGRDLSEELCKAGLATTVNWDDIKDKQRMQKYIDAENAAKAKKTSIWGSKETLPSIARQSAEKAEERENAEKKRKEVLQGFEAEILGTIVEIVHPGAIVVNCGGVLKTVTFASIKAPRFDRNMDDKSTKKMIDATIWMKGKEMLRKNYLGKKCKCVLEYARAPFVKEEMKEKETANNQPKPFYSVYVNNVNVCLCVLRNGLVETIAHRPQDSKSRDYDEFTDVEEEAKSKKIGMFAKNPEIIAVKDITLNQSAQQSRQFLSFFSHAGGKFSGIVDYVFHPSRVKVYVPSQKVMIALVLDGVRTMRTPIAEKNAGDDEQAEIAAEALMFAREKLMQRDVNITVPRVDKSGNFIGEITIDGIDYNQLLVEKGYAYLDGNSNSKLVELEEQAKKEKMGIWKFDFEENVEEQEVKTETFNLQVSDFISPTFFYYQVECEETLSLSDLHESLSEYALNTNPCLNPRKGILVAALDSNDKGWYRGKVTYVFPQKNTADVLFIDYGYTKKVTFDNLRVLTKEFSDLPPQAKAGSLAFIECPSQEDDEEVYEELQKLFAELVEGITLEGSIEYSEIGVDYLNIEKIIHTIVLNGFGRILPKYREKANAKLLAAEEQAKKKRVRLWRYGDRYDD